MFAQKGTKPTWNRAFCFLTVRYVYQKWNTDDTDSKDFR